MGDDQLLDAPWFAGQRRFTARWQPHLVLVVAVVMALISMAVCVAAILAPAPAAALPLVVAICVGAPLFAGWDVPAALGWVTVERRRKKALDALRKTLNELPEVEHPLGL
ncbi:MAG TPA: hypothetical protein VFW09_13590 [Solirubrobacteraceae bacterium]|nr:hypothetical protein [Solirubrobacteraceae bacterium]